MAELLTVYEPGETLATMSNTGEVRVWRVDTDGLLVDVTPPSVV